MKAKKVYRYPDATGTKGYRQHKIERSVRKVIKSYKPRNKEFIEEIERFVDKVHESEVEVKHIVDNETVEDDQSIGIFEISDFYDDLVNQLGLHRAREGRIFGEQTIRTLVRIEKHRMYSPVKLILEPEVVDPQDKIFDAFLTYHEKFRGSRYRTIVVPLWTRHKTYYYKIAE